MIIHINNEPEVSTAFKSQAIQDFFAKILKELADPYTLKQFLIDGWEKSYNDQIKELANSFIVIEHAKKKADGFIEVERILDGQRFKVGDRVVDLIAMENFNDGNEPTFPIGRLSADDRGLHVRLDVEPEPNLTFTWRELKTIQHIGQPLGVYLYKEEE